jgi:predicted TIM-barrel fold metal-dependent hydrolase
VRQNSIEGDRAMTAIGPSAAESPIVDAQIHLGPGGIDEALAAMDALGIGAALIDEYWLGDFSHRPHVALPNGAIRPVAPTAELASELHPDRFSYLLRVQRDDPEVAAVIRQSRDAPHCRALRIDPGMSQADVAAFARGDYDALLGAACDAGLPIFVFCPDRPDAFVHAAQAFPDLRIAIDHCGVFSNSMRATIGGGLPPRDPASQTALFAEICALSRFPNVALKWGHGSGMFDAAAWPGEGLWPILRGAVDAFGAGRVMWASDFSVNQRGESWAELLFGVRGCPLLDEAERAAVLGGALRDWLGWE